MHNNNNKEFIEDHFTFSDPEIFDIFSIKVLEGDAKKALQQGNGLLVSQSMAKKYFGADSELRSRSNHRFRGTCWLASQPLGE
jgi:putative ABC transport system permease protein